jgi:DNA-binding transcriptional LysR family regulator
VAAGAVLPRALRLLRRRLPTADLLLEEGAAQDTRQSVIDGRLEVGVWVALAGGDDDPRLVETVLRREPMCAAIPADHPLKRLDELDDGALAATPQLEGYSLRTALALIAAGEGWAPVPALAAEPLPAGVALRPLAGAPEWELRAARPAGDVLSVGTLAVMDALRRVAADRRGASFASGVVAAAQ